MEMILKFILVKIIYLSYFFLYSIFFSITNIEKQHLFYKMNILQLNNKNNKLQNNTVQPNTIQNNQILNRNKNKKNNQNKNKGGILNTITEVFSVTNDSAVKRPINSSKRHYFIGYVQTDANQIQILQNIQNELTLKYQLKDIYHNFNHKFVTRFVYMGYLTPEVANKYMEFRMKSLCMEVTQKFQSLVCRYSKVKPKFDKPTNYFSIFFDDENHYLKEIIIPFLANYGIKPLFPKRFTNYQPMFDLIHFRKSNPIRKGEQIQVNIPETTFTINHLSLISAKPTQSKMGYQSVHDNLIYQEEAKYIFPFKH